MDEELAYHVDFHGIQYVLTIYVAASNSSNHGKTLLVDIEQEASGARWTGEFASKYIEDITQKTGNFKRFSVFVNMLRKALDSGSDSVFVDLLTAADLTELKNRRSGKPAGVGNSMSSSAAGMALGNSRSSRSNGKRYLILTYTAEFDKVHYPLPLSFEEHPSPATLQRTIGRLRRELANGGTKVTNGGVGNANTMELQRQLHSVKTENEALRRNKGNAAAVEARIAFQKYRETSEMEISQLKKDCKSLASKLRDARTKQDQAEYRYEKEKNTSSSSTSGTKQLRALERKNTALRQTNQREKDQAKRAKSTSERQLMKMKQEMKNLKSSLTRMRMELREANKRTARSKSAAARSVSRGRSTTPRGIGATRRTSRGRSTSSTRSGMTSVNSSRSSINTSTNSRLSRRSVRSARSTRSTRSAQSIRSAKSTRSAQARSSNYGQQRSSARSSARVPRVRRSRRTPSPSVGSSFGSTGRRSNMSSTSSTSRGRTTRTKKKKTSSSTSRRSKRHPSPFDYSSADSRSSSIDSRSSEKGGRRRRTRMAKAKATKKKKTKKQRGRTTAGFDGSATNDIPRAPSSSAPKHMPAPLPTENESRMGNMETSMRELETSMEETVTAASRLEESTAETNFNANSEMADIDRRLNALQVRFFLKCAANAATDPASF